jgi:hypothetical protein
MMLLWLLLHMAAAAKRGSYRKGHEATPAPTASDPRVRGADALNRWFATIEHVPARARPLEGWTISHRRDIQGRMRLVTRGNAKQVLRGGTFRNQSIIVKGSSANHTRDKLGDAVHLELVFLEALRGAPGVPELLGAWREGEHVWYAVADGGLPIGMAGQPGKGTKATVLSDQFIDLARREPLKLARALLRCFRSWASAGFLLDDFKAQQFTLDEKGDVYLVDGPSLLRAFPVGEAVYRATSHHLLFQGKLDKYAGKLKEATGAEERQKYAAKVAKFQAQLDALGEEKNNLAPPPSDCRKHADCPSTKAHHACGSGGDCEAGARGAPESAGLCRAGACVAVGPWTHVFDTASRPWLLPGVVKYAEDAASRKVLDRVMSKARLADPEKRPTFDAMLAEVERHIM